MPGLLDVPVEILTDIIRELCPHCTPEQRPEKCLHYEHVVPDKWLLSSLSSLSQTCRALRDFAQPVLYHGPATAGGKFISLVRTLIQRPDLARAVEVFYIGSWFLQQDECISPEDAVIFNTSMALYPRDAQGYVFELSPNWLLPRPPGLHSQAGFAYQPEVALSALAVTQLPQLKRLHIQSWYLWNFPFCQRESLPYLTELDLEYGDTKYGADMDTIKGIMLAAPALECFTGRQINWVPEDISHGTLTTIKLIHCTIDDRSFRAVMDGFPKLEAFSYSSGGATVSEFGESTLFDIFQAVLVRHDTLKHLDIDLEDDYYGNDTDSFTSSLKGMSILETLVLDVQLIPTQTSAPRMTITGFLPSSIQVFKLGLPTGSVSQDMLQLAKMASVQFPKLREVYYLESDKTVQQPLELEFASSGVKFDFNVYGHSSDDAESR